VKSSNQAREAHRWAKCPPALWRTFGCAAKAGRRLHYAMKNAIAVGAISASVIVGGCTKEQSSDSTALPAAGSKPVASSDGTNTWSLGATTVNGTNVSTNVTVGIRTREASK
jgi:hypothetical protein